MNLPLIPATFTARVTLFLAGSYAIWQGLGIITGGPQRFAGPAFAILRQAPHPTVFWGVLLMVAGVLILCGSLLQQSLRAGVQLAGLLSKTVGLLAFAVWSFCFARGALDAARAIETIANTGGKTYVYIGLGALVLVLVDERRRARHDV